MAGEARSIQSAAGKALALVHDHPSLYVVLAILACGFLLVVASWPDRDPRPGLTRALPRLDRLYAIAIAIALFALRWPTLAWPDLEGDESVAVSAAMTRFEYPGYGLGIFTGSGGPLLSYPLSIFGFFGIRIDYGVSKLVGLVLIMASTVLIFLCLRIVGQGRIARLATLPILVVYATGALEFPAHYCSEHWINLLIMLMVLSLLRLYHGLGSETRNLIGMSLAAGFIPMIKWQGAPMAALFVGLALALLYVRTREKGSLAPLLRQLGWMVALGFLPLLSWILILLADGRLKYFMNTYFLSLFSQANTRFKTTMFERFVALPTWSPFADDLFSLTAGLHLAFIACIGILLLRKGDKQARIHITIGFLYFAVSIYAVLKPGGPFQHYLNLLVVPTAALAGLALCYIVRFLKRRSMVISLYLTLLVVIPGAFVKSIATTPLWSSDRCSPEAVTALRTLSKPGSKMLQWGWEYGYYVYAGTTWATPTGGSHEILEPFFGHRGMFITHWVKAIENSGAPVFVDTATEGSRIYGKRSRFGHERFSHVLAAVREKYEPCIEFPGARIFIRRDLRRRFDRVCNPVAY